MYLQKGVQSVSLRVNILMDRDSIDSKLDSTCKFPQGQSCTQNAGVDHKGLPNCFLKGFSEYKPCYIYFMYKIILLACDKSKEI